MKKIKLNNIEIAELQALYRELVEFVTYNNSILANYKHNDSYFSKVLLIEIAQSLCYFFRQKCEGSKTHASITLRLSEACVLLQVVTNSSKYRSEFEGFVARKFTDLLHKELTNLV